MPICLSLWLTKDLATAVLAAYAALLATYTALVQRRQRIVQLHVEVLVDGDGSFAKLVFRIANHGEKAVVISAARILLLGSKQIRLTQNPGHTHFSEFFPSLPHELKQGHDVAGYLPLLGLANRLLKQNVEGIVDLVFCYSNKLGNEYRSSSFQLNVSKLASERERIFEVKEVGDGLIENA